MHAWQGPGSSNSGQSSTKDKSGLAAAAAAKLFDVVTANPTDPVPGILQPPPPQYS